MENTPEGAISIIKSLLASAQKVRLVCCALVEAYGEVSPITTDVSALDTTGVFSAGTANDLYAAMGASSIVCVTLCMFVFLTWE